MRFASGQGTRALDDSTRCYQARRDIVRHFAWLETEAGADIAERFMATADQTFVGLASAPKKGSKVNSQNASLAALRKWRVDGFESLLVFYALRDGGVTIVRVLHGSQDWWTILDIDSKS